MTAFDPIPQKQLCAGAPRRMRVSWSKLKNWETCHQRSKLYSQGKRRKAANGRAFLPGTIADRCMRRLLEDGLEDRSVLAPGGLLRYLEEEFYTNTASGGQYSIAWRGDPVKDQQEVINDVKLALTKLEPVLIKKVFPYAYQPEYRFLSVVTIPGPDGEPVEIELLGAVDVAVCRGDDWYGLYDLKITRADEYIKSTLGQLTFYDLAFQAWMGRRPVEHQFWAPLTKEGIIPTDVTAAERTDMLQRIIDFCHGVWSGDDALAETEDDCFFCQVKHACPRFAPRITADQQGRNRVAFSTQAPRAPKKKTEETVNG